MTDHFKQLADDLFLTVKAYVGKTFDSLDFRLKAVEARTPEKGEKGLDGKDGLNGKDGEPGKNGIDGKDGKDGVNGKDGAAGIDGKDGAEGRHGVDGKDGAAGINGKDGADGRHGVDGKDGAVGLNGKDGRDGIDGKDGAAGLNGKDGRDGIDGKDGSDGLNGKDGRDGIDGKDGAAGLNGKDGADGINGKDGANGLNGKDADAEAIKVDVLERVTKAFDEIPVPKDGRDGVDGKDGRDGSDGINGKDGHDGIDGKNGADGLHGKDADPAMVKAGIAEALPGMFDKAYTQFIETTKQEIATIRRDLVEAIDLRFKAIPPALAGKDADPEVMMRMVKDAVSLMPAPKDGRDAPSVEDLRPVIEGEVAKAAALIPPGRDGRDAKDGKPGEPGRDGVDISSFHAEMLEDDRTLRFTVRAGDQAVFKDVHLPIIKDAGVYQSGQAYERGDAVSYGGSMFIARRGTMKSPGTDDWRLAVKRGQDGSKGQ